MRRQPLVLASCLFAVCCVWVLDARASELYGIDYVTGTLITIDTADASTAAIGVALPLRNALAFDANGTLYSNDRGLFGFIDPDTAAPTIINPATGRLLDALAFSPDYSTLYGLEFDGAGDGNLLIVDKNTGTAVLVGDTGLFFPSSLAINTAGEAFTADTFGSSTFYQVDLTTAVVTPVGNLGEGMTAMGFDHVGVLYGVGIDTDTLYRIDPATAAATAIGVLPYGDIRGLSARVIPEPATLALAPLGLLLIAIRRKH